MRAFRKLTALDELEHDRSAKELALVLSAKGIFPEDAAALAHNTALVWLAADWEVRPASPLGVLSLLSLGEIADLREEYDAFQKGDSEAAVNTGFEEVEV